MCDYLCHPNFVRQSRLEIMHLSLWLSASSAAANHSEITSFVQNNKINLLCSNSSSGRFVIMASVLVYLKLAYTNKTWDSNFRNIVCVNFGELQLTFSTNVDLLFLLCSMIPRHCLLHLKSQS